MDGDDARGDRCRSLRPTLGNWQARLGAGVGDGDGLGTLPLAGQAVLGKVAHMVLVAQFRNLQRQHGQQRRQDKSRGSGPRSNAGQK